MVVRLADPFVPGGRNPKRVNRPQVEFYRARAKFCVYRGGVGSGKTASGAAKHRDHALANPGCTSMVCAPTYGQLRDFCLAELLKFTPSELIKSITESASAGMKVILVNGHKILFRTADKPRHLRGATLSGFWLDEAAYCPEEAFKVLVARVRDSRAVQRGTTQRLLTTSPDGAQGWFWRKWREKKDDPDWRWILGRTEDNAAHTGDDYVSEIAANVSKKESAQELGGEFVAAEGLVYGGDYDAEKHLVDYDLDPRRPVWLGVDFGFRHSAVLAFQQRPEDGAWVCFDEEMPEDTGAGALVDALLDKEWAPLVAGVVHDPAGLANSQDSGAPIVRAFDEVAGWVCMTPASEDRTIARGIEVVRWALAPMVGAPKLLFARHLQQLEAGRGWSRGVLADLAAYSYAEGSDEPEHDDSSHSMDALRYFVLVKIPMLRSSKKATTRSRF